MKIIVTGGAGFIGSHVAEYYAKKNHEVLLFDNLSRYKILGKNAGNESYNLNYLKKKYRKISFVMGDVRSFEEIKDASKDTDLIVHTAAQVAVTTSLRDPQTDFNINVLGTFNVLEASRLNDSTLIYCSTNKVYGENVNKLAVMENSKRYFFVDDKYTDGIPENFPIDLCSHTPYGCSKLAADLYTQDYAGTYGLRTGIFRLSCIYGERQFGEEDQGWIAWFTIATLTNKPISIYGNGKQVRDVLYVSDLVNLFDLFIKSKVKSGVFNVGGGPKYTLSLLELLELLEKFTGKHKDVTFVGWRHADQKVYLSNVSKAKKLLNWQPKVNPKEGLRVLVNWVKENLALFE